MGEFLVFFFCKKKYNHIEIGKEDLSQILINIPV